MNAQDLFKKSIARAVTAPGNMIAGLSSVLLSVVTTNPLPLIFFVVGSGFWVKHAVGSHRYDDEIMAGENVATQSRVQNAQEQLEREVKTLFGRPVVRQFTSQGFLPGYMRTYDGLVVIRDEAAEIARQRRDVASTIEDEIIGKLDQMLAGYLRLSRARVMYAHVLFGVYGRTRQQEETGYGQEESSGRLTSLRDTLFEREDSRQRPGRRADRHEFMSSESKFKTLEERIAEIKRKIGELQRDAEANPNVAQVHKSHIDLLQKQIELLGRSSEQDQRVAAQLDALPAAFNYILDSVRATQFTADQVTSYMSGVIQEVDETIRFVEAVQLDDFPEMGLVQFPEQHQRSQ